MNINDLTLGQLKEINALFNIQSQKCVPTTQCTSWEIGKIYLIRTVTMVDTGKLVGFNEHELILEDAAWIADTGRFSDALKKAEFNEVEPFPDGRVIIGRGSVVDAVQIKLSPRSQK